MPKPSISEIARTLGQRARGVPKQITPEERERRRKAMIALNEKRRKRSKQ